MFDMYDIEGNGKLSKDEFKCMLRYERCKYLIENMMLAHVVFYQILFHTNPAIQDTFLDRRVE